MNAKKSETVIRLQLIKWGVYTGKTPFRKAEEGFLKYTSCTGLILMS